MKLFYIYQEFNDIQCISFASIGLAPIVADHVVGSVAGWSGGDILFFDNPDSSIRHLTDALGYMQTLIVLSDKARRSLMSILDPSDVEWIPCVYRNNQYWIMHGLVILDAIDEAESDIVRLRYSRTVMKLNKLNLIACRCRGHSIFRLNNGLESWCYVVTSEFVEMWEKSGLTGLRFSAVGVRDAEQHFGY